MSPPQSWRDPAGERARGEDRGDAVLQGTVDLVTYHDERSLYSVLRIIPEAGYDPPSDGDLFSATRRTAVGRVPDPAEGMRVRLLGRWGRHPTHGLQFEFEGCENLPPISEEGLVRYLSSRAFDGIGETLAQRIVKKLGSGALETIRDEPSSLAGIRGLRPAVAETLANAVTAHLAAHQTHAFLRGIGLGPLKAQAAVAKLGPDCEGPVRDDPYRLTAVAGIGFPTADRIALEMGIGAEDTRRLGAGLLAALRSASDDGHSFLQLGELVERAAELLNGAGNREAYLTTLAELEDAGELLTIDRSLSESENEEDALVYLPWIRASEQGLAESLARLLGAGEAAALANEHQLAEAERRAQLELHPTQRAAVLQLLAAPVGLLTGGPGVGKTTIIRLVAALADAAGASVRLASPTGRAAKRLAEATGRKASTIHRLLGFRPDAPGFEHDGKNPLAAGILIVDEISMLDVVLAHHLLKAVKAPTRLVLVGDPDQLPSVGPGNVLRDLIDSGRIPVSRLTQIFRQDAGSLIVSNAHRIRAGQLPEFPAPGDRDADFYFFGAEDGRGAAERLVDVVTRRIPDSFGMDWVKDVQVIAPIYRGDCGVDALNANLREALGIGGREVVQGDRKWRVGDKVIHTRNDYEKEVFNGDMGRIAQVSGEGVVTVRYPEQDVVYSGGELSDLRPAFAITVHRSQGGEFRAVVMPLVPQHYVMLQRNLLYTAITRARELVVLVGSRRALEMAVDNAEQQQRSSALADRLRRLL